MRGPALISGLADRTDEMLRALEELVEAESPSHDLAAVARCGSVLAELGGAALGSAPEPLHADGNMHLRWRWGTRTTVLILGHFDTVWPQGTLMRWPFSVADGRATGPGIFDMKAGLVQGLFGLAQLDDLDGIELLFNSDEEIGSPTSRKLIEDSARDARAVLVLEPSYNGALKVARKGGGHYSIHISGKASHAGLDPERGVNALVELAHQVVAVQQIARPDTGTTITPTLATAGTSSNTVPASAVVHLDVRARTAAELARVDRELSSLQPVLAGSSIDVDGSINRLPLERAQSESLFAIANEVAADLGLPGFESAEVGGGSDGNFTAALGVPTLDGLGAVGDGAHAEGEHVVVSKMAERAALVASLVDRLREAS
ncbi:MAG TPA: M20 family metallopeptidase [Actinomycetota bacterium]|nr:M20 family metallopeptidase [Actinomycetota bacterium]